MKIESQRVHARRAACAALLLATFTAGCSSHGADNRAQGTPRTTASAYTDGIYLVGRDIPPGTYTSAGAKPNASRVCSITTQPHSEGMAAQHRTGRAGQLVTIALTEDDGMVTVQGCEPLTPRP